MRADALPDQTGGVVRRSPIGDSLVVPGLQEGSLRGQGPGAVLGREPLARRVAGPGGAAQRVRPPVGRRAVSAQLGYPLSHGRGIVGMNTTTRPVLRPHIWHSLPSAARAITSV